MLPDRNAPGQPTEHTRANEAINAPGRRPPYLRVVDEPERSERPDQSFPGSKFLPSQDAERKGHTPQPTYARLLPELDRGAQERFELLQEFECTVDDVVEGTVCLTLRDLTQRSRPEEVADVDMMEFSDSERDSVQPGAVFYWMIGYRTRVGGMRERVSFFRARRLPAMTRSQEHAIDVEAERLCELFGSAAIPENLDPSVST